MFKIVFLVCSLTAVLGQDCITQVANCMKETKAKHDTEWKAKAEEIKKKIDSCFTSNGCTVPEKPTFNFTKNATWTKNANWTKNNTTASTMKATMEKMQACMKQTASIVETCVSEKIGSSFKFPPMQENATGEHRLSGGYHGGPWGHHKSGEQHEGQRGHQAGGDHHEGSWGHQEGGNQRDGGDHKGSWENHGGAHFDFAAKFCKGNNASANATKKCLKDLRPTPSQTTGSPISKERSRQSPFAEVCADHDTCMKSLNTTCQDQLKSIKAALCTCANQTTTKDTFTKCMNDGSPVQKPNLSMVGPRIFCDDPCAPKQNLAFGGFGTHPTGTPPTGTPPGNVNKVAAN